MKRTEAVCMVKRMVEISTMISRISVVSTMVIIRICFSLGMGSGIGFGLRLGLRLGLGKNSCCCQSERYEDLKAAKCH